VADFKQKLAVTTLQSKRLLGFVNAIRKFFRRFAAFVLSAAIPGGLAPAATFGRRFAASGALVSASETNSINAF
jgi:hypothetical protein